jgi:Asp-tRNA(Asn)/Glu-tRNA(Gln) amidotransferase C subunit
MIEMESNIRLLAKAKRITISEEDLKLLVSQMETATEELEKLETIIRENVPLFMLPLTSKLQSLDGS